MKNFRVKRLVHTNHNGCSAVKRAVGQSWRETGVLNGVVELNRMPGS